VLPLILNTFSNNLFRRGFLARTLGNWFSEHARISLMAFEVPGLLMSLLPAFLITPHTSMKDPDLPERVISLIHYKDFLTIFNSWI